MRFDFAKIGIRPKLKVSQQGDAYEQEADYITSKVVAEPASVQSYQNLSDRNHRVQYLQ